MLIDRRLVHHFDWWLLAAVLLIPACSLVVLYSAGYDPDSSRVVWAWLPLRSASAPFLRQAIFFSAGLGVMLLGMSFTLQFLQRYAYVLYGICLALLAAVLMFGTVSHGARRWFAIGNFSLQVAEFMKVALIIALARYLAKNPAGRHGYGFVQCIMPFLLFLVPMGLIVVQPDLGTALVHGAVGLLMVMFVGIRPKALITMLVVGVLSLWVGWDMLHPYQQRRVQVLFDPDADPLGSGYHIIQSKIAVGSGGFLGKGFLKGTQTQLQFLPEHTTDFIFSVLAEEWGFVGCMLVLLLYLFLLYRLLRVVQRSNSVFSALLVFGISAQIFIHIIVNIGMVLGLLPVVGLPLPLFSYGGSAVLSTMFVLGLTLGVAMRRLLFATH